MNRLVMARTVAPYTSSDLVVLEIGKCATAVLVKITNWGFKII